MTLRTWFATRVRTFGRDRSGNIGLMFAVTVLPALMFIGLAIDYSRSAAIKAQLDSAADGAALAAVAKIWDSSDTGLGVNSGVREADARRVFMASANLVADLSISRVDVRVEQQANNVIATVSYEGDVKVAFGNLFATDRIAVGGTATSIKPLPPYIDFYLLLDVSGSMGLASTPAGQAQMFAATGCTLACHFAGNDWTYNYAKQHNIELRVDSMRVAVQRLIATAQATMTMPNQYRVGLYPFIRTLTTAFGVSNNLADAAAATNQIDLDTGYNPSVGSGGTHMENALPSMNALVASSGDGTTSARARSFVFLVTDGAQDDQWHDTSNGGWYAPDWNHKVHALDPAYCAGMKARGVTVAVLYTQYLPITVSDPNDWNNNLGNYDGQVSQANRTIPAIPAALQACASPGFYWQANLPGEIEKAMQAMFNAAVNATRLTH